MIAIIYRTVLAALVIFCWVSSSLADTCTDAKNLVSATIANPPDTSTEVTFQKALMQCPKNPGIYLMIGDYYNHWWKNDINPENQAYFNYQATEYYAKGIKTGKGEEVDQMKHKLAALESGTEDITEVGIRSIKPYARLNIKVLFELNSSELSARAQEQLDILGQYLAESNSSKIILEGHTDMSGSEEYNMQLSFLRAESAKEYLVQKYGVSPEIIDAQGYGFDRLADVVDPYSGKNRRVRVRKLSK